LEVGQFEILEHDLDQFFERDVGLVVIDARPVAGVFVAFAGRVLAGFADDLPGPRVAVALRRTGSVVAENEAVFLDSAQWNLDHAIFVFTDDRFFGNDVGDIFADRFANFLAMAQPVAGRAVGAFGVGDPVFAEDCIAAAHRLLDLSRSFWSEAKNPLQSFHRLFAAYFSTTSTHDSQYPFSSRFFTIEPYFSPCSSSRVRALVMIREMSRTDVISFFSIASLSGS